MPRHRLSPFRSSVRIVATALALALIIGACGNDDDDRASDLDVEGWLATSSTTTSSTTTTSTTTTSTTTTEPPRSFTEADLRSVLLTQGDVPAQASEMDETLPPPRSVTDPPACGEGLSAEGPGEVRAARAFFEPVGFLSYQSTAQHTPGKVEDLDIFRAAIAGPCTEGFRYLGDDLNSFQRLTPLPDPQVGDDALAARFDVQYEVDGRQVEVWAYMVYFVRGDVAVQVQVISGAIPDEGLVGPDISIEEAVRLAQVLDGRVRAL